MCTGKRVKLRPILPLMVGDFGVCASRGDLRYKISDNPLSLQSQTQFDPAASFIR